MVSCDDLSESKIVRVIHSILPILQSDYYIKVFLSIQADLHDNLSKGDEKELYNNIKEGDDNELHKVMALVWLPEYEKLRENLFHEKLNDFPNIRQKIYRLYLMKDKRNELFKVSNEYKERVEWHLYRLYRVRNAIVHAGDIDRNIQALGEHLHIYCDGIIMEIIAKLAKNKYMNTIKDVLVDTKMLLEKKKNYFTDVGIIRDKDIDYLLKLCCLFENDTD